MNNSAKSLLSNYSVFRKAKLKSFKPSTFCRIKSLFLIENEVSLIAEFESGFEQEALEFLNKTLYGKTKLELKKLRRQLKLTQDNLSSIQNLLIVFVLLITSTSAFFATMGKSISFEEGYGSTLAVIAISIFFFYKRGEYIVQSGLCSQLYTLIEHIEEMKQPQYESFKITDNIKPPFVYNNYSTFLYKKI